MDRYMDYGIDLGTTNSCIARWEDSSVRIFQNAALMNVTPSAVQVTKTRRIIVGKKAYNAAVDDPENVAMEFKRQMGQHYEKHFPAADRKLTTVELSAEVLKALLEDAQRQTGAAVNAAVVTVPAAFGTLQCEATGRAARSAGLEEFHLLQEPIAAAIAYGVTPGAEEQRFMVFDLGGGTLDIAIVSTRDRRLTVLEHRGNNHLGGKDIDRLIVERFLFPALADQYSLPDRSEDPAGYLNLFRRLALKAEDAKIELTMTPEVTVDLTVNMSDRAGRPLEAEFTLKRSELEDHLTDLANECIRLADEALRSARQQATDLTRILLVGGPTQMPFFRRFLPEHLGIPNDHSIDPMTVVARGAAIYAANIERSTQGLTPVCGPEEALLQLAHPATSASLQCPVEGKFTGPAAAQIQEVRLDAEGGYWTSGWLPVSDAYFATEVRLREGKTTHFTVSARDVVGRLIPVSPAAFRIPHQLPVAAPPLPHSLCVEVLTPDKRAVLDPVFPRSTPLPVERVVTYRARKTVRPSDVGEFLAIKVWEGEHFADPEANWWVATLQIRAEWLRRPIPEGTPIEITIRVDTSRLVSVSAFLPYLNQHFASESYDIYLPERGEPNPVELAKNLPLEIVDCLDRLDEVDARLAAELHPNLREEAAQLRKAIEDLDIELSRSKDDPDRANQLIDVAKQIRGRLAVVEEQLGITGQQRWKAEAADALRWAEAAIAQYGTEREQAALARLRQELENALSTDDDRAGTTAIRRLWELRWLVVSVQPDYWKQQFKQLLRAPDRFTNKTLAARWVASGEQALAGDHARGIEEAVRHLWRLLPRDARDKDRETGLRMA